METAITQRIQEISGTVEALAAQVSELSATANGNETMTFDRARLVALLAKYAENENRGIELANAERSRLGDAIKTLPYDSDELATLKMYEAQTYKARGMKECCEELFYIHDGNFDFK